MRCQQCNNNSPKITETRKIEGFCYRRRVCTCKNSWWAVELFCGTETPQPVKDWGAEQKRARARAKWKRHTERRKQKNALEKAWFRK